MENKIKTIEEDEQTYKFICETNTERWRVDSLYTKEEGTVNWIRSLAKDDVLFDIGANIGLYTIYAAPKVSRVYAFEPHLGNAFRLLQNIQLNEYSNVRLIASPVHDKDGLFDFKNRSLDLGSSFSTLLTKTVGNHTEQKVSLVLDKAVENGSILAPTCLKLDVDGNEFFVLKSMKKILRAGTIKSLLVEFNPKGGETIEKNEQRTFLEELGYEFIEVQYTYHGKKSLAAGKDPSRCGCNFLFKLK